MPDTNPPVALQPEPTTVAKQPASRFWTIALIVYWLAIFTGTHYPKDPHPGPGMIDKYMHFGAFTVLAFLLCMAVSKGKRLSLGAVVKIIAVLIFYGAADELTQQLVGRDSEWLDWYADILGTLLGTGIFLIGSMIWRWLPTTTRS